MRLRRFARRIVVRATLGVIALMFFLGAIVFAHIAVWYWLRSGLAQSFPAAAGILGGADLLMAIILAIAATRSSPSRVELEALAVRRQAITAIGGTFTLAALVIPILRMVTNLRRRRS
ncbi:MAG TPA: hypothetical protein VH023_19215 [Rhodopila sp.]|nr:hypothetical protein [Rhodopila sp.]